MCKYWKIRVRQKIEISCGIIRKFTAVMELSRNKLLDTCKHRALTLIGPVVDEEKMRPVH